MNKNLQSPTKLTEFAPLQPEERQDTVGQLFSRFFKFGKTTTKSEQPVTTSENADNISQESLPSWAIGDEASDTVVYDVDVGEGRSLPSVLKRISNLLALKSNQNCQAYSDSELKQYWMPDSVSKECYECCEKFTTFRRRHHCRVCGQIFCSSCCNQQIPGKIFGCAGDLRVCTYCCKVVLSYLQSNDIGSDLTADLRALQENLQSKYGDISSATSPNQQNSLSPNTSMIESIGEKTGTIRRKISVGYQEEKFASGRGTSSYLSSEEKCRALQNSTSLRNLYEEICRPNGGVALRKQRYRMRTYVNTFLGSELVEWLIYQQKANTRVQAAAFCQALLDGGYIICLSESPFFVDGNSLYKLGVVSSPEPPPSVQTFETSVQDEPIWVQNIPQDSNNTDSEGEQISPSTPLIGGRMASSSSYTLDLNVGANTVYLSKPQTLTASGTSEDFDGSDNSTVASDNVQIRTAQQHELVPESGWHHATQLREDNGEYAAYKLLTNAFQQHETTMVKELLSVSGLSLNWSDIIMPLIHEIVDVIRPDINHNAEELDIRHYVQFKKLTGGCRNDCELIRGIVFTKNVAHKAMSVRLDNPKILLLECPIVYQRTEGRLMSLDPVLMQEQQYLTHVADRILALKPNIVLVQRNMSRLAQDILRKKGVTIVLNVKQQVLERIARCTDADLVSSIDARIGAPRLGSCKSFYLKNFETERGRYKTLMCFEGLSQAHLGCTVLLRGASKSELQELKSVASFVLFACYNWRLEKSFLMDEFAYPRVTKDEFFDDSKENSPVLPEADVTVEDLSKQKRKLAASTDLFGSNDDNTEFFNTQKNETKTKVLEEKKSATEPIQDFSDPLHSYNVDDVFKENTAQKMAVADLPFSNQFRKALDDTILCISPFLVFSVPYLETENGRKCKLRNYFPAQIYYSEQFINNKKKRVMKDIEVTTIIKNEKNMKPPHPFVTTPISTSIDSNEVQTLLTHFRACGGRLPKKPLLDIKPMEEEENNEKSQGDILDVLNPRNHQRMAVLFCSFSKESINAPAFCVNPWVVSMAFYGHNDIPLGCFLMRYCFSSHYHCQSKCETPMLKHVRKFVHYTGCVSITLNHIETVSEEEDIMMWSWCNKCQKVSPMVKMSVDTWSFSFAKYLELRFHGGLYSRRGNSQCQHSLHHDHVQYFTYKTTVASFRYTSIDLWEISLPPTIIDIKYHKDKQQQDLMDEIKSMALKGHEVYSLIQEKLSILPSDEDVVGSYKQMLVKETQSFKQKIEEIQMKLTSPTIENKSLDVSNDAQGAVWKIQDGAVRIKRMIVDAVDQWNLKLSETASTKKDDKKKDKTSSQELDNPSTSGEIKVDGENEVVLRQDAVKAAKKNRSLDKPEDDDINASPRGHHRSQSDGTVLTQLEDIADGRKESDRKSVKTIFSIFSSTQFVPIPNPFDNQEHYSLPTGMYAPVAVYESEPSSMIAYALNSYDYKKQLDELTGKKPQEQSPSPLSKRRSTSDKSEDLSQSTDKSSSIKSFFRSKDSKTDLLSSTNTNLETQPINETPPVEKPDDSKNNKIEVQFEDNYCKFLCFIYHAEKFANLRKVILPIGEEAYIRSLARCVPWDARGGKSGSTFRKTLDDRFIIKAMPHKESQLFLDSAHNYFAYMNKCLTSGQPTLLGKIVGIYQIVYRNNATNATLRTYLLVMENLFYNRVVTQKFDLKGSMRNRLVNPDNQDGEIVLLDENLLKMTCENPLYIHPHSKAVLTAAIQNDTEFLSNQCVMDYSLLVGLDSERKELVLGIIDYIRTFTWDKKLETIVKKTGILGGQGKLPTIMPPQEYQKRFIEAMHRYFLEVPDPWVGMDRGLET